MLSTSLLTNFEEKKAGISSSQSAFLAYNVLIYGYPLPFFGFRKKSVPSDYNWPLRSTI